MCGGKGMKISFLQSFNYLLFLYVISIAPKLWLLCWRKTRIVWLMMVPETCYSSFMHGRLIAQKRERIRGLSGCSCLAAHPKKALSPPFLGSSKKVSSLVPRKWDSWALPFPFFPLQGGGRNKEPPEICYVWSPCLLEKERTNMRILPAVFLFFPCILFVTHCLWGQEKVTLFLSAHSSAFFAHVDCHVPC